VNSHILEAKKATQMKWCIFIASASLTASACRSSVAGCAKHSPALLRQSEQKLNYRDDKVLSSY